MTGLLAAEWWKIRSLRSTYYVLAVVVVTVALSAVMAWNGARTWDGGSAEVRATWDQTQPIEHVMLPLVQLCMAVLGVLAITAEYSTGMIRTSLVVAPRRGQTLLAKATIVGALALVVGELSVWGMHVVAELIVGGRPIANYEAPLSDQVLPLFALGLSVTGVALVGCGLGAVLRSTAGAIATLCTVLFVLPILVGAFLPQSWGERMNSILLPSLAGQLSDLSGAGVLSPPGALAVLVAYVAVVLGAGTLLIRRRDV
jgi:ABC-2 type transport system permease protein